jgi:hypothetical protein
MALLLRVNPHGREYRLPAEDSAIDVIRTITEMIDARQTVAIGYEPAGHPGGRAVLLINGRMVESVEVIDVPEEGGGG